MKAERKAAGVPELNAREMFALRCFNAAVNLYGVLTVDECVKLYNHYAKGKPAPVSDEMTSGEMKELVRRLTETVDAAFMNPDLSTEQRLDLPDVWFSTWFDMKSAPDMIVYYDLTDVIGDHRVKVPEEMEEQVVKHLIETRAAFKELGVNILSEKDFFGYEDPEFAEETEESKALVKFLQNEYALDEDQAEFDVMGILSNARINGSSLTTALEYVRDSLDWRPQGQDQLIRLVNALGPALSATRLWRGRGRSSSELSELGLVPRCETERIPTDIFDDNESDLERHWNRTDWNDGYDDDYEDDEEEGDPILPEDIPLSAYNGPIDFKFVKDPAKRETKLAVYEDVKQVVDDFFSTYVTKLLTTDDCEATAARFGLVRENGVYKNLPFAFGLFLSEFALLLDDQAKETPCQKVLANRDAFDEIDKRAATYYENFRFTCLEILAVKAGVGMKCRDLLTGEDLFLMEKSFSQGDVKGELLLASIAPMEDVYISVGNILPLPREKTSAIFSQALEKTGISSERPIRLSFDQQRKFAAETIKAYVALRTR